MNGFDFGGLLGGDMAAFDPIGGPVSQDPAAAAAQANVLATTPATNNFFSGQPLLEKPSLSQMMLNAGIAMIQAGESGQSTAGALAAGLKGYSDTLEEHRKAQRQERADRLSEYDLLGRIRERQLTEVQAAKKLQMLEKLKVSNPEMADLIDLDPNAAAQIIADRFKPKERKIIEQGGIQYYADTGAPVLPDAKPSPDSRKIISQNGVQYYVDTGERVLPNAAAPPPKPPTEGQAKADYAAERMENAEKLIGEIAVTAPENAELGQGKLNAVAAFLSGVPSAGLGNSIGEGLKTLGSEDQKKYRNASMEWVRAKLRAESGATIGKEEEENEYKVYFPQPGDSDEVIKQKAALRVNATQSMKAMGSGIRQQAVSPVAPALTAENADAPQEGEVIDGYRFNGGDPSDAGSWEEVQ